MAGAQLGHKPPDSDGIYYEVLTPKELAARWRVPESWVRDQSRSRRCADVIPHVRLGRYIRYSWGSPELNDWWRRRQYRSRNGSGRAN